MIHCYTRWKGKVYVYVVMSGFNGEKFVNCYTEEFLNSLEGGAPGNGDWTAHCKHVYFVFAFVPAIRHITMFLYFLFEVDIGNE